MLEVGSKAPDFTLQDKDDKTVSLSDFLGKKVILYFYPKDSTPGCTRQASAFARNHDAFVDLNVVVLGVSRDSIISHQKFSDKNELPFTLLADPELSAIKAYGVWQEKTVYGKLSTGVVRSTYLIDEKGNVERVIPKAKPDTNAADLLSYLKKED